MLISPQNKIFRGHKMIITGNFYRSTAEQTTTTTSDTSSEVDSIQALKTFFDDSTETESKGFADTIQISAQALSVLRDYVETNGITEDDPMSQLIKENAMEKFFGGSLTTSNSDESAIDELSQMMQAFNEKQASEVYAQIKEANQQLSGDFISAAARYGVQSLL